MSQKPILKRHPHNPILTREKIPDCPPEIVDASSVFNPGAVKVGKRTLLMLRVQTRGRRTYCVPAVSDDGVDFRVATSFTRFSELPDLKVYHIYDARLTMLDDRLLVVTAIDTDQGCRCALWETSGTVDSEFAGLENLMFVAMIGQQDTRNAVLFPEKIGGRYHLLHRPNQTALDDGPLSGLAVHLSLSDDLTNWIDRGPVFAGHPHFWDELIGSGPPPIKTRHGWLHLYHGVATHFQSSNIYQAGAVLLDLENPGLVLGRTGDNILEPRADYELVGQVPNVVFASGAVVDLVDDEGFAPDNALVNIYYGAADTVVGLAQGTVGALVAACSTNSV